MGTRAFVQFPIYKLDGYTQDGDVLRLTWGEQEGNVYVYVGFDGDVLPVDLRETVLALTKPLSYGANMTLDQRLHQLDPEIVAAALVTVIHDDRGFSGTPHIRVSSVCPEEGYHLVFDVKAQTVRYVGEPDNVFELKLWMDQSTGVSFRYAGDTE